MEEKDWTNKNLYRPGCAITAYGIGFDPELFLSETVFPSELIVFSGKWGAGKKLTNESKNKLAKAGLDEASFTEQTLLAVMISKSDTSAAQYKDATIFLQRYRDEILRLSKFPNVERVVLKCIVKEGESLEEYPHEFIEVAFGCGITALM